MPRRSDAKQRFVATAIDLFQRQGYHGTGLNQIIEESGAPRGSLYFHFPGGKEELAREAMAEAGEVIAAGAAESLSQAPDPATGVRQLAEFTATALEQSGFERGCALATVTLDFASAGGPVQEALAGGYGQWLDAIAAWLEDGGFTKERAAERAALILAAIQGGMVLARAQHDGSILRDIGDQLAEMVSAG